METAERTFQDEFVGQLAIGHHDEPAAEDKAIGSRRDKALSKTGIGVLALMEGRIHDDRIEAFCSDPVADIMPAVTDCGRSDDWIKVAAGCCKGEVFGFEQVE